MTSILHVPTSQLCKHSLKNLTPVFIQVNIRKWSQLKKNKFKQQNKDAIYANQVNSALIFFQLFDRSGM